MFGETFQRDRRVKGKAATENTLDKDEGKKEGRSGSARTLGKQSLSFERQASKITSYTRTEQLAEKMEGASADHGVRSKSVI